MIGNKGAFAIALAVAVLITMVVGVYLTDDIACRFCLCTPSETSINASVPASVWVNNTCVGDKCATDFALYCNDTELEVGTEYDILNCDYMVTNVSYDGGSCYLEYTYEGDYYHGTDVVGLVMCNIALVMAALGLGLAGMWVWMKG